MNVYTDAGYTGHVSWHMGRRVRVGTRVRKSLKPAGEAQNAAAILYISVLQKKNTHCVISQKMLSYTRGKKDIAICLCMIWNKGILTQHKPIKSHSTDMGFKLQTDMNQIF